MLLTLSEEEKAIDPQLGYPVGYAKLCRHAVNQPQGALTPFAEGPPQRFVPYAPPTEDLQLLKEWDAIFPLVPEIDKEAPNAHEYAEDLWEQLDHLGNAGFDPAKFRVDAYGNVLYWSADPSSPLSWEVDHWFPHSRGGRTVPRNLQIVQWQARQRKKNRLEFLVPWWDLQHGVSISQFLSTFASKNAEFRRRSFALFFAGGEDENVVRHHVGDCRPWPPQYRGKKATCGLAGAAIVSLGKGKQEVTKISNSTRSAILTNLEASLSESSNRQRWSPEEEDGLKSGLQKYGPGSWKEIKEHEPALINRSAAQIKEKYRVMREFGKENNASASVAAGRSDYDRHSVVSNTMQKELRLKKMREDGKREKEQEVAQLEETVRTLKSQNEKERKAILELEGDLSKHKQKVEKQRRWAETQSSYRLCLERMIRDTMHQSISYKEQARLNQAACNALLARLDCQKMTCEAAEKDLLQRYSQREALAALVKPDSGGTTQKKPLRGRDIVDVSSCLSMVTTNDGQVVTPEKGFPHGDISLVNSEDEDEDSLSLRSQNRFSFSEKDALHQESSSANKGKEALSREGAKRKAISIGVTHVQPTKQAVHRRHFGKELKANCEIQSEVPDEKEDEPMQLPALNESSKAEESAVPEVLSVTHDRQDEDRIKGSSEEGNTSVPGCQNDLLPEVSTHSLITPMDSKPLETLQEITEVETPGAQEDNKKDIDDLMQEVISTHEDKIKSAEAAALDLVSSDDERIREIGKSNIDKWLHVLLDEEFPRISTDGAAQSSDSPGSGQPPLSPALSALSMAALRGSVEMEDGRDDDFFKKEGAEGLKGRLNGIMRKLSVKHTDEETVAVDLSARTDNRHNLRNALKSFEDFKMKDGMPDEQPLSESASGSVIPESVRNWPEGGIKPRGGADWYRDSTSISVKSPHSRSVKEEPISNHIPVFHKKSQSEDIECGEWERFSSTNPDGLSLSLDHKDGLHHKHGLRATLKACTLKWRKAAKKLDKPLQEGSIPLEE
ncbi:hypothetical protein KC19_3G143800 [Ceratodon purpureus]|uniref:Myb-like domain-containing protein n=1 Tax=Ceratodon purpureus TaxID=3225 RepID=A0A8T0II92_CERPU|nr:hypothetical protein KC19_3G143800 [Ceratodon purpureus]